MYKIGDEINVGYYGGFHHQTLIKTKAIITSINGSWIHIKLYLRNGGFRNMFGTERDLQQLEANY
jgi:hypothetical protein